MKNTITLFDLPENKVGVKFDDGFREKLFENFSFESLEKTATRLGTTRETARRWRIGKRRIPLSAVKKLAAGTNLSEDELQAHVIELKSSKSKEKIKNPRFPFNILSTEFALVVGGVLCDGGIEKDRNRVWYFNNEKQQRDSFISAVETSFGDVGYAFHRSISGTPCVIFPKIIGLILGCIGLTPGNKNYNFALGVPKQFLECDDEKVLSTLLRRMFDDDGTVNDHHNCRAVVIYFPFVATKTETPPSAPPIVSETSRMLEKLGVKNHVWLRRKNKPNGEELLIWQVAATGKQNLEAYKQKIGFDIPRKTARLEHALSRYVGKESYSRFEAEKQYLNAVREITEMHEPATARAIAVKCNRSERHVRFMLEQLNQKRVVERNEVNRAFNYSIANSV